MAQGLKGGLINTYSKFSKVKKLEIPIKREMK